MDAGTTHPGYQESLDQHSSEQNVTRNHCLVLRWLGQAASRPLLPAASQYDQTKSRQPNSLRIALIHGQNVLWRDVRLEQMTWAQDVSTAQSKYVAIPADLGAHFFCRSVRQQMLHVDAAVKTEPIAELGIELLRRHLRPDRLDWVEDVDAHLDQFGNQRSDQTAAVEQRRASRHDILHFFARVLASLFAPPASTSIRV